MFSDGGAHPPGEQKGFKSPHFIPWLRNSLKAHHSSGDLGLNGPFRSSSEARNNLTPLEKTKGISFFSIPGKGRAKKGELRCNGMGVLPVVLRGHHILPGKQREDSPGKRNQTKEADPKAAPSPGEGSRGLQDRHWAAKKHSSQLSLHQQQSEGTSVRKYGPLVGPPPTPVPEESNCSLPVALCMDDRSGNLLDYTSHTTYRHRDLHSSIWLSSDTQGLIERQQGFSSTFSYINKNSRNLESLDPGGLKEPPVKGFSEPVNGLVFSAEFPSRNLGCTATLGGPRKARANPQQIAITNQNQTWARHRLNKEAVSERREAGCGRKVVRNQIKRVVDNLEKVLTALRDVQDEMKEVVQQIDYLTSSIDLNEEEQQDCGEDPKLPSNSSYSSGSSSTHQRLTHAENQRGAADSCGAVRREHPSGSQSPQNLPMARITSGVLSDSSRTLRFTSGPVFSPKKAGLRNLSTLSSSQLQNLNFSDHTLSPQRSLPGRPPTPGLSPITVSLHHPPSPGSQPHSPGASSSIRINPASPPSRLSPQPCPPPALSPSVIIETKVGPYQTSQSDLPSAAALTPSPFHPQSASCPPTDSDIQPVPLADREQRASSAGPSHLCTTADKPPTAQGRGGRKPPPYPHNRLSELSKKVKEPRKAPPYPEKRRLLSTTV